VGGIDQGFRRRPDVLAPGGAFRGLVPFAVQRDDALPRLFQNRPVLGGNRDLPLA